MPKPTSDLHILPRPIERLPEYAKAPARQNLAERLIASFGLSEGAAAAIADAVVDPSEVRKSFGNAEDPNVESIPVFGGTLLGIRTSIWSRRVLPDPRNPRTLPFRRHPFAVEPGTAGEESRFRPVSEPQMVDNSKPTVAELAIDVQNRDHLTWAVQQNRDYIRTANNWGDSIASQGVMEAVWLVATTYRHEDGSDHAVAMTTVEGSSRVTAVHDKLELDSADVPYDVSDTKIRGVIKKLNEAFDRGADASQQIALRCERLPALVLVGFRPHDPSASFPRAVRSFVALRHVEPPKAWGEGPENEALANEVLDEMHRRQIISTTQRGYFAGSITRAQAKAANLPDDAVVRAAMIVHLFTAKEGIPAEALRLAVTSQSTRKQIRPRLRNELATALIIRALVIEPRQADRLRRYLREAYGASIYRLSWKATNRDLATLAKEALAEVRAPRGNGWSDDIGPASLELAVRATFPLIATGSLNADRGTANNDQPDRRTPGEIVEAMRLREQGIHQLRQVIEDYAKDKPLCAVDEIGQVLRLADDSGDVPLNDIYLRSEFPPYGTAKARRTGNAPLDLYENAVGELSETMVATGAAFDRLSGVAGNDGLPLVESRGVAMDLAAAWRTLLRRIGDELVVWERTARRSHAPATSAIRIGFRDDEKELEDAEAEEDVSDDVEEDAVAAE